MRTLVGISTLSLLLAAGLFAQATYVTGSVIDPSGAAIPSASITLTNTETGLQRNTVSDSQGRYTIPQVPPGIYRIDARASGFAEAVINNIELLVNEPATIEVKFEKVGSTTTTVQVEAAATLVNTTDASLGNAIDNNVIIQMPSYARNVVGLLAFQPGVTSFSSGGTIGSNDGAVNGGKPDQGYVSLDGADVMDQNARQAFTSVLRVTLDSVEEFRSTTTNGDAATGRGSGADVQLVTKSGTNAYHGSLYEYRRGTEMASNMFFSNQAGVPIAPLLINIFGGSAGGAVKKNKLFYFINYEGRRDASANSANRTVPSAALRQGIVTYLNSSNQAVTLSPAQVQQTDPGAIGANANALKAMQTMPLPNNLSIGDGYNTQGFTFNAPGYNVQNTYIAKFDYHPNDRNSLFIRGNLQNDWADNGGSNIPEFPGLPPNSVSLANSKGLAAGWTDVITPNLVSTLRYGFTRAGNETSGVLDSNYEWFRGLSTPYGTATSLTRIIPVHLIGEDLSWNHGAHNFRFGGSFRSISNQSASTGNSFSSASSNPSWISGSGNDLLNGITVASAFKSNYEYAIAAVLGLESQGTADYNYLVNGTVLPFGQPAVRDFVNRETEMYAQDTWKATHSLTITLGLRLGLEPPVHEINGQQASTNVPLASWLGERAAFAAQGLSQQNAGLIDFIPLKDGTAMYPFHKNFAPRLGLAYSPKAESGISKFLFGGPGKTSIRAGAGMYYDLIGQPLAQTFSSTTPGLSQSFNNPANILTSAQLPRFTSFFTVPSQLVPPPPAGGLPLIYPYQAGASGSFAITNSIDSQLAAPYTENFDLTVGRELPSGFFAQVAYVARLSKHSLVTRDLALPPALTDPASGQTYYQAMTLLMQDLDFSGYTPATIPQIPFFNNMWSTAAANGMTPTQIWASDYITNSATGDATNTLNNADNASNCINGGPTTFTSKGAVNHIACGKYGPWMLFNPQFSALGAWSSIGMGNYNALQVTIRKRYSFGLQFDINYTWSKSIDLGSTAESGSVFGGILQNTWNPNQMRAVSSYDTAQQVNWLGVYELPFGRGRKFGTSMNKILDAFVGGWQLSGNYRQTSALPTTVGNGQRWPTDWEEDANATPMGAVPTSPTNNAIGIKGGGPNLFTNPISIVSQPGEAIGQYGDFIETFAGQSGLRDNIRGFGFFNIDTGMYKVFTMPFNEHHKLQLRWETFNITNSAIFSNPSGNLVDNSSSNFGKVTGTATSPRQMQIAARYTW
jgi:hypothetical protein